MDGEGGPATERIAVNIVDLDNLSDDVVKSVNVEGGPTTVVVA